MITGFFRKLVSECRRRLNPGPIHFSYLLLLACLVVLLVADNRRNVIAPTLSIGVAHPVPRDRFTFSPRAEIKRRILARYATLVVRHDNDVNSALAAGNETAAFLIAYLNDDFAGLRTLASRLSGISHRDAITAIVGRDGIGEIYEPEYEQRLQSFVRLLGATLLLEAVTNEAIGFDAGALSAYRRYNELLKTLRLHPQEHGLDIQARQFVARAKIFQLENNIRLSREERLASWLTRTVAQHTGTLEDNDLMAHFLERRLLAVPSGGPPPPAPSAGAGDPAHRAFLKWDRCAAVPDSGCEAEVAAELRLHAPLLAVMLRYLTLHEQAPARRWREETPEEMNRRWEQEAIAAESGEPVRPRAPLPTTLAGYRALEAEIERSVPQATLWLDDILIESVADLVAVDPAQRLPGGLDGVGDVARLCERVARARRFGSNSGDVFSGLAIVQAIAAWGDGRC